MSDNTNNEGEKSPDVFHSSPLVFYLVTRIDTGEFLLNADNAVPVWTKSEKRAFWFFEIRTANQIKNWVEIHYKKKDTEFAQVTKRIVE